MKSLFITFTAVLVAISPAITQAQTALDFDGLNDIVMADTLLEHSVSSSFTYEAWVYPTAPHEIDAEATSGFGGVAGQNFLIWPINGSIPFGSSAHSVSGVSVGTNGVSVYEHTGGYMPALLTFPYPIVGWTHIAVVCNNKSYSLYVNGYLVKIGLTSPKTEVHPSLGGGIGGGAYGYYQGSADNLRLWGYARSQEEIVADMKRCLTGSEPGLLALYDFEEGTPSTTTMDQAQGVGASLTGMDPNTDWVLGIPCFSLVDRNLYSMDTVLCEGDSTWVVVDSAQVGAYYFLRDSATSNIPSTPLEGTGNSISLATGGMTSSATYYTYAMADYGADLSGSDDYVRFASPFTGYGNEITVEAWVNYNNGQHPFAGQSADATDNMSTNVWLWSDGAFSVNDGGTWRTLNFPSTLPTGWTHVATVANASGLYIYYNGMLVDSSNTGISNGITSSPSSIIDFGHDPRFSPGTAGKNTNTTFDDFRIWKVARSQPAIAAQMDVCALYGDTTLVQNTTFEEGTGTDLVSFVGSNGQWMNTTGDWVLGAAKCPSHAIELSEQVSIMVNRVDSVADVITACDSYTWINGITYTASNSLATDTLINALGCDSIVHLQLTLFYTDSVTVDTTIMEGSSVTVGTNVYTIDGTYRDTLTNGNGCDSIVITQLTVTPDGIEGIFNGNVRIYPNPAQHDVMIVGVKRSSDLAVLSILGQDITHKVTFDQVGTAQIKADISHLDAGVYLIKTEGHIYRLTIEK